jgi:endonuclease/exonuclease/phosphatase family metal-dependent hydrolase
MSGLRIATYNVHSCVGNDGRYDPERVLHVLHEINADVLALQEVGGYMVKELEQVHYFEGHLGMKVVRGLNPRRMRAQFGNAVLVKGHIAESHLIDLTVYNFEPRNAIDCVLETALGRVRVIATHLGLFAPERRKQIARIKEQLARTDHAPAVILGDFNVYGMERRVLYGLGAPRPLPKLRSFPARRPLLSLDRLWSLPNAHLSDLHVHRTHLSRLASDHLPLVGTLHF